MAGDLHACKIRVGSQKWLPACFNLKDAKPVEVSDLIGGSCRYCDQPVTVESEASVTLSYWQSVPFICHKKCKDAGVKQEALDCQTVDADCNDCRHYRRGKLAPKMITKTKTKDGRIVDLIFQPNIIIEGRCLKFNKPTVAQPNKWSGFECFEHRRAQVVKL